MNNRGDFYNEVNEIYKECQNYINRVATQKDDEVSDSIVDSIVLKAKKLNLAVENYFKN